MASIVLTDKKYDSLKIAQLAGQTDLEKIELIYDTQELIVNEVTQEDLETALSTYTTSYHTPFILEGEKKLANREISNIVNKKRYEKVTTLFGQLEIYKFGGGGDTTRLFEKGVNIISSNITENRESIVDKLSIIGPPRAIRTRKLVSTEAVPDDFGVYRASFVINATNARNIIGTAGSMMGRGLSTTGVPNVGAAVGAGRDLLGGLLGQ